MSDRTSADAISVLHVDDDPDFADVAATFLEREVERITVDTELRAEDAIEYLERSDTAIDCVVSDYDMPGLDGLDFCEAVRQIDSEIPFILFTGKGSEEVASAAFSAGATDYIRKPGSTEQYSVLANTVCNAVEHQRARAQRDLWIKALETANEGIAVVDSEGFYSKMNAAYAEIYGAEPADLVGEPWTTTVPEPEVERLKDDVFPALEEMDEWTGESIGKRVDDTQYPKLLSLTTLEDGGHVCVVRDLSDLQIHKRELRKRSSLLDAMFEYSPDMIDIHDGDGEILRVNRKICEELGYTDDELIGMSVWEIDRTNGKTALRDTWSSMAPGESHQVEGRFRRKDGSTFPAEVHLAKMEIDGEARFIVISRDISEQKQYQRQLEKQNERLEEFASLVSHDLRNPLSVADGHLELLRDDVDNDHVDAIQRSHDRMRTLIDDLLSLSRAGESIDHKERVELETVAQAGWAAVTTENATLTCTGTGDVAVQADQGRLQQLFENLFRNAVEHGGSDVTVTVGRLSDGEGFYVADDGPGIAPAERDEVFESGYSSVDDGTGFGLAIVDQIADAHGWSVGLTESGSGGARFEFRDSAEVSETNRE